MVRQWSGKASERCHLNDELEQTKQRFGEELSKWQERQVQRPWGRNKVRKATVLEGGRWLMLSEGGWWEKGSRSRGNGSRRAS